MNYSDLQSFAKEIVSEASKRNILSRMYWYTPKSRKTKPVSKIGYYDTKPTNIRFDHGCKLLIVFPRLAFNTLEKLINEHMQSGKEVKYREDFRCRADIGFDVYQRVNELELFIEPDMYASESLKASGMSKRGVYWADCQRKALEDVLPPLTEGEIFQRMTEVSLKFKNALEHLNSQANSDATLQIRRLSGVRHRMVRINLVGDKTNRQGFSDLVLVFGTSAELPQVKLPKEPKSNRKVRSDSISAQYHADKSSFKYYDKFGIFEVYDK